MTAILYCQMQKIARTISQSSLVLWFNPRLHDAMKFGAMLYISRANTGPEVTIYTTTAVILHIKHKQYKQNKNLCQSGNTFVYSIQDDPLANLSTKVRIFIIEYINYEPILIDFSFMSQSLERGCNFIPTTLYLIMKSN